jgi:cyclopropane fatty-acyl-phospholipid synthase-like methyltransferase
MDTTQMAVAVFDKRANLYQEKFMNVDLYADTFDVFSADMPAGSRLLDIACGPGNITRYLLHNRPDLKVLGIDLAPAMVALAKANNPSAEFMVMDCRDIRSLDQVFDGIVCGFCLPYLSKESAKGLIADAAVIVRTDGVIYLSTMEGSDSMSGIQRSSQGDELYMYYHQGDHLCGVLAASGFTIVDIQRKVTPGRDGEPVTDLVIIARKL